MSAEPRITQDQILAKVTKSSFERGDAYFAQGLVERMVRRGNRLFAEVQGSEFKPYKVGVALKGDDFTAACSCPYDWEGYCKHIVAALLTYMSGNGVNGGDIETGTPIEDLLADMSADDLRTLALLLVDSDPRLVEVVDEFCSGTKD